jgi:hypothetical protein
MAQTAVDWLFKALWEEPKDKMVWYAILDKAKEMEKEQMGNLYTEGFKRKAYISELMQPVPEWNEKVPEDFIAYYEKNYGENRDSNQSITGKD